MSRYFFDIHNSAVTIDDDGLEYADPEAAIGAAVKPYLPSPPLKSRGEARTAVTSRSSFGIAQGAIHCSWAVVLRNETRAQ